jgi:hypothetical protein
MRCSPNAFAHAKTLLAASGGRRRPTEFHRHFAAATFEDEITWTAAEKESEAAQALTRRRGRPLGNAGVLGKSRRPAYFSAKGWLDDVAPKK